MPFPTDIVDSLVSWTNPQGTVKNSELELAGGVVHSDCVAQCFLVNERTTLLRTDNTAVLRWQHKGSSTCTSTPAHLLRLQSMHQRFHRYVPRVDFIIRVDNLISDRPSRSSDLTENQILTYLETNPPQTLPWRLWNPPPKTRPWPPSRLLTEVQHCSRCNILCGLILYPCDVGPDLLKSRFRHCRRQRRIVPNPIPPPHCLPPGEPSRDPMPKATQIPLHPGVQDPCLCP